MTADYKLIEAFGEITGVDVLLNTSFNVAGEPIVCTGAGRDKDLLGEWPGSIGNRRVRADKMTQALFIDCLFLAARKRPIENIQISDECRGRSAARCEVRG